MKMVALPSRSQTAAFYRDAAEIVDLTRLASSLHQSEIGAKVTRLPETGWVVDGAGKRHLVKRSNAWYGHQPRQAFEAQTRRFMSASIALRAAAGPRMAQDSPVIP